MRTKVVAGKRNMFSVMANAGFGETTIYRPDGAIIVVPQAQMNKTTGTVKKTVARRLNDLTPENIRELEEVGVHLYVGESLCAG